MTAHGPPSVIRAISAKPSSVEAASATSHRAVRTVSPRSAPAATIASALSCVRAVPMTSYPTRASSRAVASPIPLLAPVTTTLF